jgi:GNAT superfamily N-acetyltransferase
MLIARCPASELATVQLMEQRGFLLMDTLLYYVRHLAKPPIPEDRHAELIRPIRAGEEEPVKAIAAASFKGYFGHYHADARLDKTKCDETYISWAVRSCTDRSLATEVLVADIEGQLAGFATLRRNSDQEGEGVLFGVAPWAQGRGIYRSFMIQSMEWGKSQGFRRMLYSTQVTNISVQKVWVRVGAEMSHAYYTFHKWFDEGGE